LLPIPANTEENKFQEKPQPLSFGFKAPSSTLAPKFAPTPARDESMNSVVQEN
jgi:hypothetical protein